MTTTRTGPTGTTPDIASPWAASPAVRERARALRAMIEALPGPGPDHHGTGGPRVVLVVGVDIAADGVGRLLAGAFAESRQRTMLVEAATAARGPERGPARRPSREQVEDQLAAALGQGAGAREPGDSPGRPATGGLVEWGAGREGPHALPMRSTGSPYLVVVPHGAAVAGQAVMPPDRWAALLDHARDERDRVIVVVSPLSRRADGLTLARLVDGTVLVLAPGQTTASAATRAHDAVRQAGGTVLGVVLADR